MRRRIASVSLIAVALFAPALAAVPVPRGMSITLSDDRSPSPDPLESIAPAIQGILALELEVAPSPRAAVQSKVPPGFEHLVGGGADPIEGELILDVDVQGVAVGQVTARVADGVVTILTPDVIEQRLPVRVNAATAERLGMGLARPVRLGRPVCVATDTVACEPGDWLFRIEPALERFKLELWLNSAYFEEVGRRGGHMLSTADRWATVFSLSGVYSDAAARSRPVYSMEPYFTASRGALRVVSTGTLTQDRDYEVEEAYLSQDVSSLRYELGVIEPQSRLLSTSGRFYGATLGSQVDTRIDREVSASTRLLVAIERESLVEVFRGERLINYQRLSPGLVELDTRRFPAGSYFVRLRITPVVGGDPIDQLRFFTKSLQLPPADAPRFQLTLGRPEAGTDRDYTVLADLETRLGDRLVAGAFGAGTRDRGAFEISLSYLLPGGSLEGALSTNSAGASGWSARAQLPLWGGAVSGAYAAYPEPVEQELPGEPAFPDGINEIVPTVLVALEETYHLSGSWLLPRAWHLSLDHIGLRYGEVLEDESSAVLRAPPWRQRWGDMQVQVEFRRGESDHYLGFSLSLAARHGNAVASARSDQRVVEAGSASRSALQVAARQYRSVSPATSVHLGGTALWEEQRQYVYADAGVDGHRGVAAVQVARQDTGDGAEQFLYTGSFGVSLFAAPGEWGVSRPLRRDALYVAEVEGQSDSGFDVVVDGQPRAYVAAGGSTALRLPPYRRYAVNLRARDQAGLHYDATPRTVVLLPGNVQVARWRVQAVRTLFGRALDPAGQPLAYWRIEGALDPAFTDELGYFQVQLARTVSSLGLSSHGEHCVLELAQEDDSDEDFVALPDQVCR